MIDRIQRMYRLLGWDSRYAEQDIKAWDNPNNLNIEEELEVLIMWTKRNQWRKFTQKDYRMRFQSWLRRTKRQNQRQIEKIETKTIIKESKPIDIYRDLPDRDAEYDAFVAEVIKRYRSGSITPEYLESAADDDPISGVIGLIKLGYLGGKNDPR
jgi:hypothetical protein